MWGLEQLKNPKIMLIVAAILIVLGGVYYYMYVPSRREGLTNSKTAEILFFYADWCPHCKKAKPAVEEVKAEFENKMVNGYSILFTEIDCTDSENPETAKIINQYGVKGFPTIKLLKDGQVIDYEANPTHDTLVQFINTTV